MVSWNLNTLRFCLGDYTPLAHHLMFGEPGSLEHVSNVLSGVVHPCLFFKALEVRDFLVYGWNPFTLQAKGGKNPRNEKKHHVSGQMIATSHFPSPQKIAKEGKSPYCWWNIIIWPESILWWKNLESREWKDGLSSTLWTTYHIKLN